MTHHFLATMLVFAAASATSGEIITVCTSGCQYTSIQEAVNASGRGDVIQLSAETYSEPMPITTGDRTITILGTTNKLGAPTSVIDGTDTHAVLRCGAGSPASITLRNLVIQNGDANDSAGLGVTPETSVTIENCWFLDNSALNSAGGAIGNYGTIDINHCRFEGNRAENGGAIDHYPLDEGTMTIRDSIFTANFALSGSGALSSKGPCTVEDCLFLGNIAQEGGAIGGGDDLTVRDCVFDSNIASGQGGGAVKNTSDDNPTFISCTFINNSALNGGAFLNFFSSSPTIRECVFEANSATALGGAIVNSTNSSPLIESCEFRRNGSGSTGGVIHSADPTCTPEIRDTLFCENDPGDISGSYTGTNNTFSDSCTCPDADADGVCDDEDQCPGAPDLDEDGDGVPDCVDGCPTDSQKTDPGRCGCGTPDTPVQGDFNCDGVFDRTDYAAMQAALGICPGDIDGNGAVDGADLGLLFIGWGQCP